jgi:diadenosine tetraphosphatase ApaH/serine/threonine PP2A family protein phosphatase
MPDLLQECRRIAVVISLPPDLQKILDDVDAADRAGDAIVAGFTDEQLHWQPDDGKAWSIAQCLDHLAVINLLYGGAMRTAVIRRSRSN